MTGASEPVVAWLIDVAYVVKAGQSAPFRFDYVKGRAHLEQRLGKTAAFLFNSYDPAFGIPDGLRRFYDAMRAAGMVVRLHPMSGTTESGTHRQRRVDVDVAAHLVWQASREHVQGVVLTSGDQDYVPAVALARGELRTRVVLFTYRANVSADLRAAVDEHWIFEDVGTRLGR